MFKRILVANRAEIAVRVMRNYRVLEREGFENIRKFDEGNTEFPNT